MGLEEIFVLPFWFILQKNKGVWLSTLNRKSEVVDKVLCFMRQFKTLYERGVKKDIRIVERNSSI